MIHAIQLSVELDPSKMLIKWDVQNAFNEFLREVGFEVGKGFFGMTFAFFVHDSSYDTFGPCMTLYDAV